MEFTRAQRSGLLKAPCYSGKATIYKYNIHQDRSEYDLKEYSSLQKVLEQDELVKTADSLLGTLDIVKRNIIDDAPLVCFEFFKSLQWL